MSGRASYLAGLAAEDQVAREYARRGHVILSRRWRGAGGEIDLITEKSGVISFIEVKKSHSHARAAERVSRRQLHRIASSAEAYVGYLPKGSLTDMRLDVALLDEAGRISVLENVTAA